MAQANHTSGNKNSQHFPPLISKKLRFKPLWRRYDATETADVFLTAKQVRARYGGASDMWLWRRLHDDSGFPKPLVINKRRLWRLGNLISWERIRASVEEAA